MKILFCSSEALPFIKTGGLADVVYSLGKELAGVGHEVSVVIPFYKNIKESHREGIEFVTDFSVYVGNDEYYVGILKKIVNDVTYYFIDNGDFFYRDDLYGYEDDIKRFAFFSRAMLDMLKIIDVQPDILHLNDWQTGMIPYILNYEHKHDLFYQGIKTVYTIHNILYQGIGSTELFFNTFNISSNNLDPYIFHEGDLNMMKAGIETSDVVTTVSDTYKDEICLPYYGEGLHYVMNYHKSKLYGIVNGIDYDEFNPRADKLIYKNYTPRSLYNKHKNKLAFQEEFDLEVDEGKFMIGVVSRMVENKGLPLILSVFDEIMNIENIQLVILGSGDSEFENFFRMKADQYPNSFYTYIGYNNILAHKIYASCDAFLMPSRFEPCGLSQLISLRYGTVPIVKEVGGLYDTVKPYNIFDKTGHGVTFSTYNAHDMLDAIYRTKSLFDSETDWKKVMKNGINQDFSWDSSMKKYIEIYESLID